MNKISYLILEDESKSRQTLLQKIDMCNLPDLSCVGLAANADEALWLVEKNLPEILLVDINLPGKNGFEFLESIKNKSYNPEIIFTSAYTENEYLLKALKSGPVNYLIKPIDIDELAKTFEKAIARILRKKNQLALSGKIKLTGMRELLYIKSNQIVYCKADGHFSKVVLTNGKTEIICQNIGSIEKELPDDIFFRIDRSSLVNMNLIESIDLKRQTCFLREEEFSLNVEISLAGLKRLMIKLEKK